MKDKERLEEIQKEVNYAYRRDGSISTKAVTMPIEHYEHLYEQAERVQELEREFELYDIIHHKIGMTLSNPDISDNEKWEEVNKLLAEAWESDCIHCNGKGFNGLEACDKCSRGKTLLLEQQNEHYLFTINAMQQILKDARHSLDAGEKVQGLEYGIGMADAVLEELQ